MLSVEDKDIATKTLREGDFVKLAGLYRKAAKSEYAANKAILRHRAAHAYLCHVLSTKENQQDWHKAYLKLKSTSAALEALALKEKHAADGWLNHWRLKATCDLALFYQFVYPQGTEKDKLINAAIKALEGYHDVPAFRSAWCYFEAVARTRGSQFICNDLCPMPLEYLEEIEGDEWWPFGKLLYRQLLRRGPSMAANSDGLHYIDRMSNNANAQGLEIVVKALCRREVRKHWK